MDTGMDNAPLRLELMPIDDSATAEAPIPAAPKKPSATTERLQHAVTATEAALDAIDITPVARPALKVSDTQSIDPYVAQALREHASEKVDSATWERALAQVNGDVPAAETVYVRSRAAALRAQDRLRREARQAALAARDNDPPYVEPPVMWQRYKLAIAGATVVIIAIAAGIYMASGGDESSGAVAAVTSRPAAKAPAGPDAAHAVPVKPAQASVAFDKKVQELRDAGNFNVMVLYATEWTRKEPDNAAAWDQLRTGYVHLRQYEDARSAARKAVQLAPDDARMWRNLANVNMDLDDPDGALAAYEQASARNSADVDSLHAIALLNTRLGKPQEAKGALDRAAAASPADPITACLRTGIAQMTAARDAYTVSRQVRAIDNRCHGRGEAVASSR
jgi:tetratricopeptide (TPR) repeat protein